MSGKSEAALLFKMEQTHFWHIGRCEIIFDIMERNHLTGKALEVGCGNGSILSFLRKKGIDIDGVDIDSECLQNCRLREPTAKLFHSDICSLISDNKYDMVGAFDVLEHIDDDAKALQSIRRLLKPGGKLLLTVPAYQSLWSAFDIMAKHMRRYEKREICKKLEANGYRVLRATYFMFFLFPVIASIRIKRKDTATDAIETKTVPIVNDIFLLLLRIEKLIIRYANLPFGSSMLILAERVD